ncbi:MAG: hypothetical protein M9958_02320 [Chitinophagales bacterium]|nr:hypothetical protein [Chitinophagales bacterium]
MKTIVDLLNKFCSKLNEGLLSEKDIILNRLSSWAMLLKVCILKVGNYCFFTIDNIVERRANTPCIGLSVEYCGIQNCKK